MKKKFLCLIVCTAFFFITPTVSLAKSNLKGKFAIVIDAKSGEVLYEKNANKRALPASTTKVMTALIASEHLLATDKVKVSKTASKQYPSNYFYRAKAGEILPYSLALSAMLVLSCNDIAYAISETPTGSNKQFISLMNQKVKQLGLKNTHFQNPSGLHDAKHYTTAYDLAMIMKEAIQHIEIIEAMKQKTVKMDTNKQSASIFRRDKIDTIPYAIGGKTGYTDQARNTLVVYGKKGNKEIIAVTMKSTKIDQYKDIKWLFSKAFTRMKESVLIEKGQSFEDVTFENYHYKVSAKKALVFTSSSAKKPNIQTRVEFNSSKDSYKVNDEIGFVHYIINNTVSGKIPLLVTSIKKLEIAETEDVVPNKGSTTDRSSVYPIVALFFSPFLYVFFRRRYQAKKYKV